MPAERAFRPIAVTLPPLLLGSSQIHMPSPRNAAGRSPAVLGTRTTGTGSTTRRITRERRPARSVTRTEIVPGFVPAGTRTTQPAAVRRSFVASAPRDQRKLTRIPDLRRRPRSWTCLPICTCGRARHSARRRGDAAQRGQDGRARAGGRGSIRPACPGRPGEHGRENGGENGRRESPHHSGATTVGAGSRAARRAAGQRSPGTTAASTQFTTVTMIAASAAVPNELRWKSVSQSVT